TKVASKWLAADTQRRCTATPGSSGRARPSPPPKEASDHLLMTPREPRRLSELVEQLLSLSRIRSGRIAPVRRRVDLNAIAREVVDSQVLLIRERAVKIDVGLEPQGLLVDADPALLHQVVANLVNNAIKYSPVQSTVAIRTERRAPGSGADSSLAVLSVRDSGPGVAVDERDRIFEEFYRAPRPETQQVKGSGLGLTIAREIVQIHGGLIGVNPGPAGGSEFYFSLPAAA